MTKYSKATLSDELEDLINKQLDTSYFPYVKGNSIRIGQFVVRENKRGYFLIYDSKENRQMAKTFCKTSAVALAKTYIKDDPRQVKEIERLDDIIARNFNDAIFYKHTIRTTKEEIRKFVALTRYDLAAQKTREAKELLDSYIYY
jgi:hypothetical protein|tara:strand:- start:203 stop:637 length:435 start_codon:yes stop_codon:yes gene_type:complete